MKPTSCTSEKFFADWMQKDSVRKGRNVSLCSQKLPPWSSHYSWRDPNHFRQSASCTECSLTQKYVKTEVFSWSGQFLWGVLATPINIPVTIEQPSSKNVLFNWGKQQIQVFKKVKDMLQSADLLIHLNSVMEVNLTCDASSIGLGAHRLLHWASHCLCLQIFKQRWTELFQRPCCNIWCKEVLGLSFWTAFLVVHWFTSHDLIQWAQASSTRSLPSNATVRIHLHNLLKPRLFIDTCRGFE